MTRQRLEVRYPCPVCLGATLEKARLSRGGGELVLDACPRCGGIWFELGEVQRLRAHPPAQLWTRIQRRTEMHRSPCHGCHVIMDRNAATCPACGSPNEVDCPSCHRPLRAETHEGLRLDVCRQCKGVWFDHVELASIWTLGLAARPRTPVLPGSVTAAEVGGYVLLDALTYSPELVFFGARAAGMAVQGGAQFLASAPEAAGALAEGAGDAAAGVFEAVLEIIGGIFN